MTFKTLTILEKSIGDPLEVVAAPKRIAAPYYGTGGGGLNSANFYSKVELQDGALDNLYVRDTSFGFGLLYDNGFWVVDESIFVQNSSLGTGFKLDSSSMWIIDLSSLVGFVRDSSMGPDFVFDTSTLQWKLDITNNISKEYVDGSIAALNASVGLALTKFIPSASLGNDFEWNNGKLYVSGQFMKCASFGTDFYWDASNYLEVSTGLFFLSKLKDVSLHSDYYENGKGRLLMFAPDISMWVDSSTQDPSEYQVLQWKTNTWVNRTPVDISGFFYLKWETDASFSNVYGYINSLNTASKSYVDGSLAYFVRSSSIGTGLTWNNTTHQIDTSLDILTSLTALTDVSIVDPSHGQVLAYDASNSVWRNDIVDVSVFESVDITDFFYTKTQIDAQLKYKSFTEVSTSYTLNASDNLKVIKCDASLRITLPDNLTIGFTSTIINASNGYVTLNASTLHSQDSSILIRDKYGAVSVVHYGLGEWFAYGSLK